MGCSPFVATYIISIPKSKISHGHYCSYSCLAARDNCSKYDYDDNISANDSQSRERKDPGTQSKYIFFYLHQASVSLSIFGYIFLVNTQIERVLFHALLKLEAFTIQKDAVEDGEFRVQVVKSSLNEAEVGISNRLE